LVKLWDNAKVIWGKLKANLQSFAGKFRRFFRIQSAEQKQKDLEFFAQAKNLPKLSLPLPGYKLFEVNTKFSTKVSGTLFDSYPTYSITTYQNKQISLKHCLNVCELVQGCFGVNYQEAKKDEETWDECVGLADTSSKNSAVRLAKTLGKDYNQGWVAIQHVSPTDRSSRSTALKALPAVDAAYQVNPKIETSIFGPPRTSTPRPSTTTMARRTAS